MRRPESGVVGLASRDRCLDRRQLEPDDGRASPALDPALQCSEQVVGIVTGVPLLKIPEKHFCGFLRIGREVVEQFGRYILEGIRSRAMSPWLARFAAASVFAFLSTFDSRGSRRREGQLRTRQSQRVVLNAGVCCKCLGLCVRWHGRC